MGIFATTRALLRHLRVERGMALLLLVVVIFTSFIMAAVPRLYNQTLDDELQYRVAEAPPEWRNISVTKQQRSSVDDGEMILERLSSGGLTYFLELPLPIQEIISGFGSFTESQKSPLLQVRGQPVLGFRRDVQLRFQNDLDGQITLIDGRWPEQREPVLLSELTATPGARGETPLPLYEIAVSDKTIDGLEFERLQLIRVRLNGVGEPAYLRITGVFTVNDVEANYWNGDTRLDEPVVSGFATDFGEVLEVVALPPVETYEDILSRAGGQIPWHNEWLFYVDSERLTLDNYPVVSAAIRELKITLGPIDQLRRPEENDVASIDIQPQITFPEFDENEPQVQNELPRVMESFADQARLTSSVIALATLGILGVGLAALGLLAALIADRRRGTVTLLRSRGASKGQLAVARLVEGLLICIPGVLLGLLAANLIIDARSSSWSLRAAAATGLLTVVLLLGAAAGNIMPRLGALLGSRTWTLGGLSLRRVIIETVVVIIAAVGIFLLRQRGLDTDPEGEGLGGFDPFLTAVPVLLALAAGIALLRLYPYPVRFLAWLARRLRGTVLFMGLRRMAYQSTAANLPLLVLLLAVGVSVFTSIVAFSVDQARIDLSWTEVRADYRLDGSEGTGATIPNVDLTGVEGVEAEAREFQTRDALLSQEGLQDAEWRTSGDVPAFTMLAIEPNAYAAITSETAIAYDYPPELLEAQSGTGIGTIENPIPAIVPSTWPEEVVELPEIGAVMHFKVSADQLSGAPSVFVRVVASRPTHPGLSGNAPFVITRWDAMEAAINAQHARPLLPTTIYLGGENVENEAIQTAIAEQALSETLSGFGRDSVLGISIESRQDFLTELRDAPLARGLTNSFRLSVALAAIYAGLVVIVALVLTARERSRDLGYLRTLGLDSRQALGMTLTETIPGVLLACGLGVPLGIAIARLAEPGLDLRAFVGPDVPIAVLVDRPTAIAVAAGLALVALLSVAVFSLLARRIQLGEVLRVGE